MVLSLNRDEDKSKGQAAMDKIRAKLLNFWSEDRIIIRMPPEGAKDWGECCERGDAEAFRLFKEELERL